jgi:hypothetical protein
VTPSPVLLERSTTPSRRLEYWQRATYRAIPFAGFLLLVGRNWTSLAQPQFIYEEAGGFWAPTFEESPVEYLFKPWAGFLRVGPRAIFLVLRLFPSAVAPVVGQLILFAGISLLASFVLSSRMAEALPSRPVRAIVASFLFVLPGIPETLASSLNLEWFLLIFLICLSVATVPPRPGSILDWLVGGLSALTGPGIVVALPLIVALRGRQRRGLTTALVLCAAAQIGTLVVAGRKPADLLAVPDSVKAVLRAAGTAVVGARFGRLLDSLAGPMALMAIGVVVGVLIVYLLRLLPRKSAVALASASAAIAVAGLVSAGPGGLSVPGENGRYFVLVSVSAAVAAASGLQHRNTAGLVLASGLVIGVIGDLRIDPIPVAGWADSGRCIGAAMPCRVEVYPPAWSVEWPGIHRGYRAPSGITPEGFPVR